MYSYAANNPTLFIDNDSDEIAVKSWQLGGITHIDIKFTAKIFNQSSINMSENQLRSVANRIGNSIAKSYSGVSTKSNLKVTTTVDISTTGALGTRHTIRLVDQIGKDHLNIGRVNTIGGRDIQLKADMIRSQKLERTSAHEFGHAAGLRHTHPDGKNVKAENLSPFQKDNLMCQTRFSKDSSQKVSAGQILQIKERFSNENTGK